MAAFNLNDNVSVELTPAGEARLLEFAMTIRANYRTPGATADSIGNPDGNKRIFQMWEFMQVFGQAIYMGCPQLIADNRMDVTSSLEPEPDVPDGPRF